MISCAVLPLKPGEICEYTGPVMVLVPFGALPSVVATGT